MKLTRAEFAKIRPLQWQLKYVGDMVYNTPASDVETELFWLDFMRLVFAPKYKLQNGVTDIRNFNQTQPVLITDSLELILPTQLESAMYYANNTTTPFRMQLPFRQLPVLIVAIIVLFIIVVVDFWRLNYKKTTASSNNTNNQTSINQRTSQRPAGSSFVVRAPQ